MFYVYLFYGFKDKIPLDSRIYWQTPSPKHKQFNFLIIYIFNCFSPFSYDFYSKWTKENDTRLIKKIVSEFNKEKRIICTVYFAFK